MMSLTGQMVPETGSSWVITESLLPYPFLSRQDSEWDFSGKGLVDASAHRCLSQGGRSIYRG